VYYTELGTDKVTEAQLEEMTGAINEQMAKDFCPAFGLLLISWSILKSGKKAKPNDMVIMLMDQDKTEPGALGYHSVQNKRRRVRQHPR
jgi:hypothetical protein